MPTLDWIGKNKVLNHHNEVPFRVLDKQYTYKDGEIDNSFESENKIIHGDNLEALKSLLPEYEGKIKCIYIDPPYNTGNEGWVYNDNVNDPKIKKWLGEVVGQEGEDLTRHDKWLCMMYPRLKLLHRLLSDDGAIFISIDDNEQADLKLICDEIFGSSNFITNMLWKSTPGSNTGNEIKTVTEYVLLYVKNKTLFVSNTRPVENSEKYNLVDEYVERRGKHVLNKLDRRMTGTHYSEALNYQIQTPDGTLLYPGNSVDKQEHWNWRWSKEKVKWGIENGFIVFKKMEDQWSIYFKQYFSVNNNDELIERSSPYQNFIEDVDGISSARGTADLMGIFNSKVFDYPKPINLIEHLLRIVADKNCVILDSFAGSGTTAHAVLNMNKADGGNRKFILVEMMDYVDTVTTERLKRVIKGYRGTSDKETILYDEELTLKKLENVSDYLSHAREIEKENRGRYDSCKTQLDNNHLKVIGKTKASEDIVGTGGDFTFYELGKPLFKNDFLNEEVDISHIRNYIWFTETHTSLPLTTTDDNEYFLGSFNRVGYWFNYEKDKETCLNREFLKTMKTKSEQYIIYADKCCLAEDFMRTHDIVFKKIPREIQRF